MLPKSVIPASAENTLQLTTLDDPEVEIVEDLGEDEVDEDDRQEVGDEALGGGAAHTFSAGLAIKALVAGDQTDRRAEEDALDQAVGDAEPIHDHVAVAPVQPFIGAVKLHDDDVAADDARDIG